jgi:branched-chain amino acid transport system permease protein
MIQFVEQVLNGAQYGVMLFLMAAGLTLVFGIMNVINLAHGSLYMVGAYVAAAAFAATGSFLVGFGAALLAATALGIVLEIVVFRRLYARDHLDQVLATFGLILFFNEAVRIVWGSTALYARVPALLAGRVELLPGVPYPAYRLAIIAAGLVVGLLLYLLISRTRLGMLIRAGASNRVMLGALGVNVTILYTMVFALGAALAALAGVMAGPIFTVESGMGESVLISAFVVIVIGGIGSIRGAFVAALLVGMVDAMGRAYLRPLLAALASSAAADSAGPALASMLIYILMAAVLFVRPQGLFPPRLR